MAWPVEPDVLPPKLQTRSSCERQRVNIWGVHGHLDPHSHRGCGGTKSLQGGPRGPLPVIRWVIAPYNWVVDPSSVTITKSVASWTRPPELFVQSSHLGGGCLGAWWAKGHPDRYVVGQER